MLYSLSHSTNQIGHEGRGFDLDGLKENYLFEDRGGPAQIRNTKAKGGEDHSFTQGIGYGSRAEIRGGWSKCQLCKRAYHRTSF